MGELPFVLFATASHSASKPHSRGQRHTVLTVPEALWQDISHRHSDEQHSYFFITHKITFHGQPSTFFQQRRRENPQGL